MTSPAAGAAAIVESTTWIAARVVSEDDWRVNTWVVRPRDSREAAVIDFGASVEQVQRLLTELDCFPTRLLLTHGHHDHVAHAQSFADAFDLPIEVHASDRRLVRQAATWSISFSGRSIRTPQRVVNFDPDVMPTLGTHPIEVTHAPGHTPGSVCLVVDELVFTGDTVLHGKIGRTDLPGGDDVLIKSTVEGILQRYPAHWHVLPGHGATWTIGEAREWWRDHAADPPVLNSFDA